MAVARELCFEVQGLPPAKGEALSMLGAGHSHAPRVVSLLRTAQRAARAANWEPARVSLGLEVVLIVPPEGRPSDATNYLGGIADVLQGRRAGHDERSLAHLGDLIDVSLLEDDRLIAEVLYREQRGPAASYRVRLWHLTRARRESQ